jgi:hypothetical protein
MLPLHSHIHRFRLFFLILILLGSAVLIWARWNGPNFRTIEPVPSSQEQRIDATVEAELITATPTGFEPAEITRPQGRFLLAVDNQSGLDSLDLYLEHETDARVNATLSRKGKLKWREILDLPAGNYALRAANDPSWRCNIRLVPR